MTTDTKLSGMCLCGHWDYEHLKTQNPLGVVSVRCQPSRYRLESVPCGCDDYRDAA